MLMKFEMRFRGQREREFRDEETKVTPQGVVVYCCREKKKYKKLIVRIRYLEVVYICGLATSQKCVCKCSHSVVLIGSH